MSIAELFKAHGDVNVEDQYPKWDRAELPNSIGIGLIVENRRVQRLALVVKPVDHAKLDVAIANHEALLEAIGDYRNVQLSGDFTAVPGTQCDDLPIESVPLVVQRAIALSDRASGQRRFTGEMYDDGGLLVPSRINFVSDQMIITNEHGHRLARARHLPSGISVTID